MLLLEPGKTLRFDGGILLGPSGGIEASILLRDAGSCRGEPGVEGGAKFPDCWAFLGCEILLLPSVPSEVVELVPAIFVVMNELPVSTADNSTGLSTLVSIVRVMPEQVAGGDFTSFEKRYEAHSIDVLGRERFKARQL